MSTAWARLPRLLRRIAAVLILVCLVLPMSRCAMGRAEEATGAPPGPVARYTDYVDVRPIDFVGSSPRDWWIVLAFAWPALSQLILALYPCLEQRRGYFVAELVLALPSAWLVYWTTTLGLDPHLRYGTAVFTVAITVFVAATARMLWSSGSPPQPKAE